MEHKKSKVFAIALAVTMFSLSVIVVTFAWLYDKTESVTNTWTVGKVYIELKENAVNFELIPGESDDKDPTVTVETNSENCYVFVKIDEDMGALTGSFDRFIEYKIADGWAPLDETNHPGIYYRKHDQTAADTDYPVLKGDKVSYPKEITSEMLQPVWDGGEPPSLTFTAYAIQDSGMADQADAWAKLMEIYGTP